jgi:SAM-dependent methyltransferase
MEATRSERGKEMRRFWDRRAREDAYYFVDNRLHYGDPDMDRFWSEGEVDLDKLLSIAGKRVAEGDVVVDIGCGVGRLCRTLAKRAQEVWGVDVSEEMLNLARQHNSELTNVNWLLGDGRSLAGIPDASVDGIVSLVVFQHIPDPELTLSYVADMGRILRPGGWAAFQISNDPSVHRAPGIRSAIRGALSRAHPRGQTNPAWLGSAVKLERLREVMNGAGLEIDVISGEGTQFCLIGAHRA